MAAQDGYIVSIKGVVQVGGKVVLLRNERNEWELPGGRTENADSPEATVEREIAEELGIRIRADHVVDAWMYNVLTGGTVLVVTYSCRTPADLDPGQFRLSSEHSDFGLYDVREMGGLRIPLGYVRAVARVTLSRFEYSAEVDLSRLACDIGADPSDCDRPHGSVGGNDRWNRGAGNRHLLRVPMPAK